MRCGLALGVLLLGCGDPSKDGAPDDGPAMIDAAAEDLSLPQPTIVPTFESFGVYWNDVPAPLDADDIDARVAFRKVGDAEWRDAMPLWFDARDSQYRGSLVHLTPDTDYEVMTTHDGGGFRITRARTWSEQFPVARTVALPEMSTTTLEITEGGNETGYVVYEPAGASATIDVGKSADFDIVVKARFVIIRGLTLRGARHSAILLGATASNNMDEITDVVIEGNDISAWGTNAVNDPDCVAAHPGAGTFGANTQSAIYSRSKKLERVTIQRNRMHHPSTNANSWKQYNCSGDTFHPQGPQAISFFDGEGHFVIRYNEIYSDADHYFNDSMGEFNNFSTRGFPNRDTDIYGNVIRNCWDDGLELEGGDTNVRVWGNFIDQTYIKVALASVSKGPIYVWRNIGGSSRTSPVDAYGQGFFKSRNSGGGEYFGGGRVYIMNNTVWRSPTGSLPSSFVNELDEENRIDNYRVMNNIIEVYQPAQKFGLSEAHATGSTFDYDLVEGRTTFSSPQEAHGLSGRATFEGTGFDEATHTGTFTLAPASLGRGAGVEIPGVTPASPDIGAHQSGEPPMEFGVDAYRD